MMSKQFKISRAELANNNSNKKELDLVNLEHASIYRFPVKSEYSSQVEWKKTQGLTTYPKALEFMEERVAQINRGVASEMVWLVEHPPLFTAGTSAKAADLLHPDELPVYKTGRGGQYTYHGPGQRIIYLMLDLKKRQQDIRALITAVEELGIKSLAAFGIQAERREDRVGIWVAKKHNPSLQFNNSEEKIAAIGLRLRKWVSFHGMAINIHPDLSHYQGIVPCGISEYGVTSMHGLGQDVLLEEFDTALQKAFIAIFGSIKEV